jgi:hypothetical protein
MRRHLVAGAVTLLPWLVVLPYGCSDEPEPEDMCGWLGNPDNCYRRFAADVGDRCGAAGLGNAPKGSFLARDALDICILSEGGQVILDPPLDLATLPPETVGFKIINPDGSECGSGTFQSRYSYSLTINPDPVPDGGTAEGLVVGGTFSSTRPQGEIVETSCPTGEAHVFNQLQIEKCPQFAAIRPQAEIELNAGGIDPVQGFIRLRMYFPPTEGDLENAQPTVVEYFDCAIPPAPKPCVNGVQDGNETDVDCGGNDELCPTRCEEGQKCLQDSDCQGGLGCEFELGLKKCLPGGATGGAGGTGGSGGAGGG